jgi:hypothetical protein
MKLKKKFLFYLLMAGLVFSVPYLLYVGYHFIRIQGDTYHLCKPYGQLDPELGWTLKPNVASCLSMTNKRKRITYFHSEIFTNELGFRDLKTNRKVPKGAVVTIGDSFTFGYGVDYKGSYPYLLSQKIKSWVVNMGVPAYGSGSVLLLLERHVNQLKPSIVIYFTQGLWHRSMCASPQRPKKNLIPCFWWNDKNQTIELITPQKDYVEEQARNYNFPWGSVNAGHDKRMFHYLIKPLYFLRSQINNVLGIEDYFNQSKLGTSLPEKHRKKMLEYEIQEYARLAEENKFVFFLVDPSGYYETHIKSVQKDFNASIIYMGQELWKKKVLTQLQKLTPEEALVPGDGHFSKKYNEIIASELQSLFNYLGLLPEASSK